MYVKKSLSNGKVYLSFVQGYRANGKVRQKTIEKLGYLEDLEKIYEDPVAHFKKIAAEKTLAEPVEKSIEITLSKTLPDNCNFRKNLGYAIPKAIYNDLDIRGFFQKKQRSLNIEYNLNSIFSLLVFNRFLFPSSKKAAYDTKDMFFESFHFSLDDIYRALDYFNTYSKPLQRHLYEQTSAMIKRDNQLAYYDVTNYYFEIPYEDDDEIDENGKVKKGTRKKGPSKENRKDPIVQMGLLMDSHGIPMAFDMFPGNESEKTSLLPIIRRSKSDFELGRVIVVADRGLNTSDNTVFLSGKNDDDMKGNDGYVYGQSVMGGDEKFKEWVLKTNDYITSEEKDRDGEIVPFVHKSRIYAKTVKIKGRDSKRNKKLEIYQKQMVYFSEKYAKKQKKERDKVIAKANDMIRNPQKYTRATSVGAAGYVNNISFSKDTGEIVDGKDLSLNMEKIKYEEQFDGYYSIVTSEKNLTDKEIRDIYKGLWEIEESFRIIKGEFDARPIFVRKESHIEAHFLICFVALIIMRLLEHKTQEKFSIKQLRKSLINYSCSYLEQNYYLFDYRDDCLKSMGELFGFDLSRKYMKKLDIKKVLKITKEQ